MSHRISAELAEHVTGVERVRALADGFTPEAVAAHCDVPADEIRTLARELAAAPSAAVYGRIGTSTVEFGTLASWLVDVLNVLTGNLDRPGGAMFPLSPVAPGAAPAGPGRGFTTGRWHSRVSGYPEAQVRTARRRARRGDRHPRRAARSGRWSPSRPTRCCPRRTATASTGRSPALDFMVSVDPYLNETTRHAHVVLPPPPPSQSAHYDFALNTLAVRNNARYSPPALPLDGRPDEPEILARLALILYGIGTDADPRSSTSRSSRRRSARRPPDPHSPVHGRDRDELAATAHRRTGYERRLDMMLRLGPYGDGFGADPTA